MSYDGERSPKRQRLESYSPASPPFIADKEPFVPVQPQTPPPSIRMSPSWTQSTSSNQPAQTSSSGTFPTPPSTAGFQNHMAGRSAGSETGGESERQTPASDYEGATRKADDGDAEMMDRRPEDREGDLPMADAEHRRTDHERQGGAKGLTIPDSPACGLFKLSTTHVPPSRPHPSQNMIDLYDLNRIQKSVARRDPVTGEKINKLRKSYESKVKNLGLEGRNKAQANPGILEGLVDPGWDDPAEAGSNRTLWQTQHEESMLVTDSNAQDELFSKLDAALAMAPGHLPGKEHKDWHNQLGLDDATTAPGARTPLGATKTAIAGPAAIAKTAPALAARSSAPASPRNVAGRPERSGKKRRYDDNSFEGYTGYEDDGYSTGGVDDMGRRGSNAKRQKRSAQNSPAFASPPNSNSGIGVRSS